MEEHDRFMDLSLRMVSSQLPLCPFRLDTRPQAQRAYDEGEVPVGCVLAKRRSDMPTTSAVMVVAACGRNQTNRKKNGTRHAEFEAIDRVIERARGNGGNADADPLGLEASDAEVGAWGSDATTLFADCTLYVTVEPCIMCASALLLLGFFFAVRADSNLEEGDKHCNNNNKKGIKRVYYGCGNDRFGGCGSVLDVGLMASASSVVGGFEVCGNFDGRYAQLAVEWLRRFYNQENINGED